MKVIISRYWERPEISVEITQEKIELSMPLTEFVKALAEEMGNPAMLVTQAQLLKRLDIASSVVVSKMKEASREAV